MTASLARLGDTLVAFGAGNALLLAAIAFGGLMVSGLAVALQHAARRATFATRAAALQACVVFLFVFSVAKLLPSRELERIGAPRLAVPRAVTTAFEKLPLAPAAAIDVAERRVADAPTRRVARTTVALLVVAWLMGAILVSWRVVAGAILLRGIRRRACPHSTRGVLVSDEIDLPFVYGWPVATIVVPASCDAWSSDEWHAVITHEAAHVARGDVAMQWVRQATLALHWFNPAVRWLLRVTDEACEGACDDAVLLGGALPSGYAEMLLDMATGAWPHRSAPAATIAGRGGFERRVHAMLEGARQRRLPARRDRFTPRAIGMFGGLALAMSLPGVGPSTPNLAPRRAHVEAPRAAAVISSDTVEALLALGALLRDANPIVRASARDALRAWRSTALTVLPPIARAADPSHAERARFALAALGVSP